MAARGVYFAITNHQRGELERRGNDDDRIAFIQEVVEEAWDDPFLQETDKAWDAIHRCLSEFPANTPWFYPVAPELGAYALPEDHGTIPLKLCVLGGERLIEDESRYFIRLIEPAYIAEIVSALDTIDRAEMRERYFRHCSGAWPEYGEEDFEYTWEYFVLLRDFFHRMAGNGRAIIFTADQ